MSDSCVICIKVLTPLVIRPIYHLTHLTVQPGQGHRSIIGHTHIIFTHTHPKTPFRASSGSKHACFRLGEETRAPIHPYTHVKNIHIEMLSVQLGFKAANLYVYCVAHYLNILFSVLHDDVHLTMCVYPSHINVSMLLRGLLERLNIVLNYA